MNARGEAVIYDIFRKYILFVAATGFDDISFITRYFFVNLFASVIVLIAWYSLGQWVFRQLKNVLNHIRKHPQELKFSDVWSNIFETNMYVNMDVLIKFYNTVEYNKMYGAYESKR